METIATKEIRWTLKNGNTAAVDIVLTKDAQGYTCLTCWSGIGKASGVLSPTRCALPKGHPALAAGASHGSGQLCWTPERQAEIMAAYAEVVAHPDHVASVARKAENLRAGREHDKSAAAIHRAMNP